MKLNPTIAVALMGTLVWSCNPPVERVPRSESGDGSKTRKEAVALIAGHPITVAEFETELTRRFARTGGREPDAAQQQGVLDEMIRFRVLLARAREAGIDREPEVLAAFDRMVVGRFREKQFQQRGFESVEVASSEIEAYYRNHPEQFVVPKRVRAGILFCQSSSKAAPEQRKQLREKARSLLVKARHTDEAGFCQLVLRHSEDQATRYAGGDTGWLEAADASCRWPSAVVQAAFVLSQSGELAPLVETPDGFYLVKLLERQMESRRLLSEVRDGIEYRLRTESRDQRQRAFYEELRAGLEIETNQAALDLILEHGLQAGTGSPPRLPE